MKPKTKDEKRDLIEHCIEVGGNLEDKTNKTYTCHIGWLEDGLIDMDIYLVVNHKTAWFITDKDFNATLSSDLLKIRISKFITYDGVYLELNGMIDEVYKDLRGDL